jgi:hypothetical protein
LFLEEKLAALSDRVDEITKALREQEHRFGNELMKISARSGLSPETLAKLLEAVARSLYDEPPPPATNGTAQDDGVPTNKDLILPAQNGGVLADLPGEPVAEAADGGMGSDQVVAPPVEDLSSPAVDEPPAPEPEDPEPERGWDSYIRVVGRTVYAPRCELYVTTQQAQIVDALLSGPKTVDELSAAQGERVNRMTVMRMGSMATTLRDGGLKIVCVNGKHWLRPVAPKGR